MSKFEKLDNAVISASSYEAPSGNESRGEFKITRAHLVLMLVGALLLCFIGFISLARSVAVTAITADLNKPTEFYAQPANVAIDATLKLPLGNRVLVLPGNYQVELSSDGFETNRQTLEIGKDRHQQFELVLTRLPGNLEIVLPEPDSAEVYIDGELAGRLPGTLTHVAAGKHEVTVDAPLYRPSSQSILVRGKGETQKLEVELQPAWAEYSFSSVPSGASVVIDDQVQGKTPVTLKVEEGTRNLRIEAPLFKPFTQVIGVVAGEGLSIPSVDLIPADGLLSLDSKPTGAAVILNNEYRGTTPIKLNVTPNTAQRVQVYKAGYRLSDHEISLAPEQEENKQFALQQDIIAVNISVSPPDAQVVVDGQPRGRGSQTLSLNTLPHTVSVRKPGYVTQTTDIIPTRANKQLISVNLLTEEQHYWAQLPNSYTSKLGHSMKLFKNLGDVKMGSSRREDGRRANEVVFEVELTKPFYVALHETTNKQFRAFKKSHSAGNFKQKSLDANKAPAVNLSWQEAALYCNWLSKAEGLDPFYQTTSGFVSGNNAQANGYRLLTEAEWAWLARNKDSEVLTYPWGAAKQPSKKVGNFADVKAADLLAFTLAEYDDGYRGPAPVGRFPENHRGLFDLEGNASEWVNDWYSAKGSSELGTGKLRDPLGPDIGEFHVVRGGSWAKGYLPQLRLAYRDFAAKGKHDVGFRIARYAGLNKKR